MTKQRRFGILLLLLPLLLGLTSCVRYRVEYDIVDKEQVRLNWDIGIRKPEEGAQAPGEITVENICQAVVKHAQTPEELAQAPYEDDLFHACRFTGELPINHKRLIGPVGRAPRNTSEPASTRNSWEPDSTSNPAGLRSRACIPSVFTSICSTD